MELSELVELFFPSFQSMAENGMTDEEFTAYGEAQEAAIVRLEQFARRRGQGNRIVDLFQVVNRLSSFPTLQTYLVGNISSEAIEYEALLALYVLTDEELGMLEEYVKQKETASV